MSRRISTESRQVSGTTPNIKNKTNRSGIGHVSSRNGLTDAYAADRFIVQHGKDWRFNHDRGEWLTFDDAGRWRPAKPGEVEEIAIELARSFARQVENAVFDSDKARERAKSWARYCQQYHGIRNVLGVTRLRPPITTTNRAWNTDPWLVGAPNGTVDLRKGTLRSGRRKDLISLSLGVPYDPTASCPRWKRFVREIFEEDRGLVAYLQRVLGYVLTGSTMEQVWWLLHGGGSNGKSVLLNVVRHILGDYAKTVSFDLFAKHKRLFVGDGAERLVDARFVTAREAMEGVSLDEGRMKSFTGSDPIPARPLYRSGFEFDAKFKLFLSANHMPTVTDTSFSFWRRLHVIRFHRTFVKGTRTHDENLETKLRREGAGILTWMVQGALEWQQRGGLFPPEMVTRATSDYERESDTLSDFIQHTCEVVAGARCPAREVFTHYAQWATTQNIPQDQLMSMTTFGRQMKQRFERGENNRGRFYKGLRLKAEDV